MSKENGQKKTITANDMAADSFRLGLETALGQTGFNSRDDLTNRNHYEVFGWPRGDLDGWDEDNWLALYLRNAYAQVVNDKPAFITWRDDPEVVPRNGDNDSEFTELVDQLARNTRMWSYCERADRAAGIGQHGLLLVDTAQRRDRDDWETDAREESLNGLDGITGFRPILETQIEDVEFGTFEDERWGEPIEYTLDLSEDVDEETQDDPLSNLTVHWSRVIDVPATRKLDDDTFARPRMEPVLNNLLDIEKTLGAAAEAAYRAADYGLHLNADPTEVDLSQGADDLAKELQRYEQDLQRYIRTQGVDVERLGGDIQDPSGIIENNLDAISAETGIPKNELRGSVQGEMAAADQAKQSLFGMAQERREQYANPYIVRELVDRLIELGVLPMPEGGYEIKWPDLHELSENDRAEIQQKRSSVIANVPGLVGQKAINYLQDGAEALDDEEDMALPAMDEQNPDIQAQFEATTGVSANREWNPELHPRDEDGEFTESPISDAVSSIEQFAEIEDVQKRESGQFAGSTELQFMVGDRTGQRNLGALALDEAANEYKAGGIVRFGEVDIPENLSKSIANDDLVEIANMAGKPQNVSVDMGEFTSAAPHIRTEGPVPESEMNNFLEKFSAAVNEWFYPYDAEVAPSESEELQEIISSNTANQGPSLDESIELKESAVSAAQAALDADDEGLIPDNCGTGRGTQRANQIVDGDVTVRDLLTRDNGTPIPAYVNSHSDEFSGGAEDTPVSEWSEEMWSDCGNVGLARWGAQNQADVRWWKRQANDVARQRDGEIPYPEVTSNATRYEEGDPVQTPQGFGVVTEVRTGTFEGKGDKEVEASESSPTYIVALQDARVGVEFYSASQLEETEFPETDVENPVQDVKQTANTTVEITENNITANQWEPPESWEESDTPARVIALDAWSSMGGQFDCRGGGCCMGTMRPELGQQGAEEFCASFKDWILGGWEGWRKGG